MASRNRKFLDGYLPYALRRADQTLSAPFYAHLADFGIARSEWRLLAVLYELGELSVLDLADAALSPQPTVTHALRRLEKRGLITRTAGKTDRRQRIVAITPAGEELTTKLIEEAKRLEADHLAEAGNITPLLAALAELTSLVKQAAATNSTRKEASGI